MRILITNDDGIEAEGLAALKDIAQQITGDVWTVAPLWEQSGKSRALTIDQPLRFEQRSEKIFTVTGTPVDCVIMAVRHLIKDGEPDLVLSGINHGGNLAEDAGYSATVAGAMEGAMLGIRSIALSQVGAYKAKSIDFSFAQKQAPKLIENLLNTNWQHGSVLNINFPDPTKGKAKGFKTIEQGRRQQRHLHIEERHDLGKQPYCWYGWPQNAKTNPVDCDLTLAHDGFVTLSALKLDLNDRKALQDIEKAGISLIA